MCKQQAALFQVQRYDDDGTAAALLIPGELEVQGRREHAGVWCVLDQADHAGDKEKLKAQAWVEAFSTD